MAVLSGLAVSGSTSAPSVTVRLYRRSDGVLLDEVTTTDSPDFSFEGLPVGVDFYLVVLDLTDPQYNAKIVDFLRLYS